MGQFFVESEVELVFLGQAFKEIKPRDHEEQDARGFNKALEQVWNRYEELREGSE